MKTFKLRVLIFTLVAYLGQVNVAKSNDRIMLDGDWHFAIDDQDKGVAEKWYNRLLPEVIALPGSMSGNGKGFDISLKTQWTGQIVDSSFFKKPQYAKYRQPGNIKVPFWLQPLKYYAGAAWYQREVTIPKDWKGKNIRLILERCHWESRLWVDNQEIGMRNSLGTPHLYDLSTVLTPGKHILSVCMDNRVKDFDPGVNSHSISDHTQTNWNGMIGQLYLESRPSVFFQNIQVYPDIHQKKVVAKLKIANSLKKVQKATLTISAEGATTPQKIRLNVKIHPGTDTLLVDIPMGDDVKLWSEFHPNLYKLNAELALGSKATDTYQTSFGMREIKVSGRQLLINEKPLYLRGTLECAIFPKTGFPPTEIEEWLRIFRISRAYGLNHIRFHSWCPPQVAFDAADQMGFYLQIECSSWANQSTTIGDGKPFDQYLYEESERMVEAYGNHPSFSLMAYGNEPGGKNKETFLAKFVSYWKSKDSRRIYTSGAGWPNLDVNDYLSTPDPRIQAWGEELKSIINGSAPASNYDWNSKISSLKQPVVSHEIGQWCVYPDFKEISKYTGVVRAKNFEVFQETLTENGMAHLADSFLLASGKLQALCYKADIEAALRTKGFGGFQLLDLHDFPGQGTALVGVLNPFWDDKGYISSKEYSRFCNSTVPLARLKKHIYNNNDTLKTSIEVAHYGDAPLNDVIPTWKISDVSGKTIFSGKLPQTNIALGNCIGLGEISVPLESITKAQKLILEVSVTSFSNSWDLWVYPVKKEKIAGEEKIKVVSSLDNTTTKFLENGGSVLLSLKKGSLKPEFGGNIGIGFSSIFWNTAWTSGQAPQTLGILCNPQHPSLADFPTEYYSNWQWWDAMSHSNAIILSSVSADIKPIVRVIDDWVTNRPLALIFELKVGKGKLLVSGIDFNQDLEKRPEAKQLLFSLKKYMSSKDFNPTTSLPAASVQNIIIK